MDQREMLLGYSQLLSQVADTYMTVEQTGETGSRTAMLTERENNIGRVVLGRFMVSCAKHLERMAAEPEPATVMDRRQKSRLEKSLRAAGMILHHFYKKENRNGFLEVGMMVSGADHDYYDVAEVAYLLSKVMRRDMLPMPDTRPYIHDAKVSLCFQEAPKYQFIGGYAKATKEDETVSGDSYLMREFGDGTYIAAIADGMGSGEEACRMSEGVLELLERYIEAGLSVQDFREACNSFLYMRRDLEQSVTVDIMECNQYTGEVNFYKNGGCSSYLMQEGAIRKIPASQQALGIGMHAEDGRSTAFLEIGDWIVMMSDGVMDFYRTHEDILHRIIKKNELGPNELATDLLGQVVIAQGGKMEDDMTVLALCACES